jgi:hypothetical protein
MKRVSIVFLSTALAFLQAQALLDLFRLPGKVIAEGTNQAPEGNHRLKTYRVEEISFTQPTEVEVGGRRQIVQRVFRVTVIGERFPVRALPPVIWIGDTRLFPARENAELTEVSAITSDAGVLREGATIAFSFGQVGSRETLRERLQLKIRP